MARKTASVNLAPLRRFRSVLERDLRRNGNGPIRRALRQWAARYRGFARRRFAEFSKGGGNWPPLKPATIRARRRGDQVQGKKNTRLTQAVLKRRGGLASGGVAILRDEGTLFGALDPNFENKPGQLTQDIPFGVRVGYGGPARHPKGGATIADIAAFHDQGAGHNPQREIIVEPHGRTINLMAKDMQDGLNELLADVDGEGIQGSGGTGARGPGGSV